MRIALAPLLIVLLNFKLCIFFPDFHFAGFAVEFEFVFNIAVLECERLGYFLAHGFTLITRAFAQLIFDAVFGYHYARFAGIPLQLKCFLDVRYAVAVVKCAGKFIGYIIGVV